MLAVLAHAEINLFGFDKDMAITMLEGSIKWGTQQSASEKAALVGNELVNVLETTTHDGPKGAADFIEAVQRRFNYGSPGTYRRQSMVSFAFHS